MSDDLAGAKITTRVTVEKVDMSGDTPKHIETVIMQDGRVVSVERPDEKAS